MRPKVFTLTVLVSILIMYGMSLSIYTGYDPEQRYPRKPNDKYFSYTKEYSIKQFNSLKDNRATLVFGTSQIHSISSEMMKKNILNFHNLYCEPGDILNFLSQLNSQQISNIDEIIFLIDISSLEGKKDSYFIDYSETTTIDFKLTWKKLKETYVHIMSNLNNEYSHYLNIDGSMTLVNPSQHIGRPMKKPGTNKFTYDILDSQIDGLVEINNFIRKNNIKVTYITPVAIEQVFVRYDLNSLHDFYVKLMKKGIKSLNLFYFIDNMSNLQNREFDYIAFKDAGHLNQVYVEKWLHHYILKNTQYRVNNLAELKSYFEGMSKKQKELTID